MKFFEMVGHWQQDLSDGVRRATLTTACYIAQHGMPIYMLLSDMNEMAENSLMDHIWRMFQDRGSVLAVNYGYYRLSSYLDEQDNPLATALNYGAWGATAVYTLGKFGQFHVRLPVLAMQAGKKLSMDESKSEYQAICRIGPQPCSTMRVVQGALRDWVAYLATKNLISAVGFVTKVSYSEDAAFWVETPLQIYNNGRYVLTMIIPQCDRHLWQFMKQYVELALAMGLSHYMISQALTSAINAMTGLHKDFYQSQVTDLLLIVEMMVAAKMQLPVPVNESNRAIIDPILAYQSVLRFMFDTFAKGLKSTLPPVLKRTKLWGESKTAEPIMQLSMERSSVEQQQSLTEPSAIEASSALQRHSMWQKPIVQDSVHGLSQLLLLLLPNMLSSVSGFADDPVVKPTWRPLRRQLIDSLEWIQKTHGSYQGRAIVSFASLDPSVTAEWTSFLTGFPEVGVELLVKLVVNKSFMQRVNTLHQILLNMPDNNKVISFHGAVETASHPLRKLDNGLKTEPLNVGYDDVDDDEDGQFADESSDEHFLSDEDDVDRSDDEEFSAATVRDTLISPGTTDDLEVPDDHSVKPVIVGLDGHGMLSQRRRNRPVGDDATVRKIAEAIADTPDAGAQRAGEMTRVYF